MTTAASSGARENRFNWVGHHSETLLVLSIVTSETARYLHTPGVFKWVFIALTALVIVLGVRHDRLLCERCIADWPLDGEQRAEKRRPLFGLFHVMRNHGILFSLGLVAIALPSFLVKQGWVEVASSLGVDLAVIALFGVTVIHRRYQPWCPQCRGGGGPKEVVPDPVPQVTNQRTR